MIVFYPSIICKNMVYYIDKHQGNIKHCEECYNDLKCVFKKMCLKKVEVHESIEKNSESLTNNEEIVSCYCDVCKERQLITMDENEGRFDQRCVTCRDLEGDIAAAMFEKIHLDIVPNHVQLSDELKADQISYHKTYGKK